MSEIKSAEERIHPMALDDKSVWCNAYFDEVAELRAAYEALQKENAAQAKRIEELEAATDHLGLTPKQAADGLTRYKAQVAEIESLRKQVEDLTDILVCVTHHDGALQEYKPRWISIVQDELSRRRSFFASKNGE